MRGTWSWSGLTPFHGSITFRPSSISTSCVSTAFPSSSRALQVTPMLPPSIASLFRLALLAGIVAGALSTAAPGFAATWDHARGDAANSGFADVYTQPAVRPSATVTGLGVFAPGAGPVIGPDGTVYLGDEQGVLFALHADGSVAWRQQLGPGQSIQASPVVDTDGSIYVVGEHDVAAPPGSPANAHIDSTLTHIAPTGAILWTVPFPEHFANIPEAISGGTTRAAPNIWRNGSLAVIIVPAVYKVLGGGSQLYLVAFSPDGGPPREQSVTYQGQTISGGSDLLGAIGCYVTLCFLPGFHPTQVPPNPNDLLPTHLPALLPAGVGIFTFAGGGLPWVIVNDPWQQTVGYTFSLSNGFREMFRTTDSARSYAASPLLLPDGHSVTAASYYDGSSFSNGHLVFTGPNGTALPNAGPFSPLLDTPARTLDGRLVVTGQGGEVIFLSGSSVIATTQLPGQTIVSPAVSRSHVFVSTASSLRTFDVQRMTEIAHFDWTGGGLSGPAIGPSGSVYVLAANVLYVFPGLPRQPCPGCRVPR